MDGDGSVRFDRCCFATQRHHFAEDADGLVGESLKIGCVNPRSSFRGCHIFSNSVFKTDRVACHRTLVEKNLWKKHGVSSATGRRECGRIKAGAVEGGSNLDSRTAA